MGQGKDRARRLSLGTAITFAVAAIAGVVGGRVSGHVTPALIVFVVLVIAGMAVSYWVDHRSREDKPDDGGAAPGLIDARGAREVQNIIAMAPGSVAQGTFGGGRIVRHQDALEPDGEVAPAKPDSPAQE